MASQETRKIYALDLDREEWVERLAGIGQPKFRADQLVQWLWQKHVYDADEMTNLSKSMRDEMKQIIDFQLPDMIKEQRSKDGTRKFLWRFRDGQTVESVLMQYNDRLTACVSTQAGCPLQCLFCATGLSGYARNLSSGEIAAQFLAMEKIIGHDISNVVYMGMGEPFLNTENVLKSIRMLNDDKMRNLGIRHFTVSTSGVLPGIIALANSGLKVRLAISLHAVDDELRGQLMPINQKYPLAKLREAMEEYQEITGDRITIEYAMFGGVNDSVEHARALVRYLKGIHVFINLIPFNAVDGRFEKPSAEAVLKFRKVLDTAGFEAEIRQERGADIDAACGQLRRKASSGEACRLDDRPGFQLSAPEPRKTASKPATERVETRTTRSYKRSDSEPGSGRYGTERKKTGGGFAGKRSDDRPRKTDSERGNGKFADERTGTKSTRSYKRSDSESSSGSYGTERKKTDGGFAGKRADDRPRKTDSERGRGKFADERTGSKSPRAYKRSDSESGSGSYGTERKKTGGGFAGKRADDRPRKTDSERGRGKFADERTGTKSTRSYKRSDSESGSGSYRTERKKTDGGFAGKRADDRPRRTDSERGNGKFAAKESTGGSGRKTHEKTPGKKSFEKQGDASKRRRTAEPDKEHYRSGKKKEERPSFKGQREGSPVEREGKRYDGTSKQRASKPQKASAKRTVKASSSGAKRKPKTAPKQRTKKK